MRKMEKIKVCGCGSINCCEPLQDLRNKMQKMKKISTRLMRRIVEKITRDE